LIGPVGQVGCVVSEQLQLHTLDVSGPSKTLACVDWLGHEVGVPEKATSVHPLGTT